MSTTEQPCRANVPAPGPSLLDLFTSQREAFRRGAPEYAKRMQALKKLEASLLEVREEIVRATNLDFGGRARQETLALELAPLVDGIRHARKNLARWMKPRRVAAGVSFFPARARIIHQPLGVVGILGAWNYPTLLTLSPLADAIAAGNHAMVKPSELAPRTAEVLQKMIAAIFPTEYVAVVTGDAQLAADFSRLPFDHLLFTGSTRVGKLVMRAAAENLTPVTLELGGKCPAIIHSEYPLRTAVERIMAGKLYNAGQTCLAPDYVLVHESQRGEFVQLAGQVASELYPAWDGNADYTRIINSQHFDRLNRLVCDAVERGARPVAVGAPQNPETALSAGAAGDPAATSDRLFRPLLLLDVDDTMQIMQEEIFGPVLPVLTYRSLDEALSYINGRPHPLAVYYFDNQARRVDRVLYTTTSGGVTVNDVIFHIAQNNLPFGGVGASGMGHYHGRAGFATFSKKKGVFLQSRFSALKFLRPPYGPLAERIIRFLLRG
ncbi:MAG TPA: coniferyl aldehyde dehydrogenase [Candidatus Acidoferrum sp.]|nr:coniferyl aldehyde dehydrogenase [Candidatus Acidoferrum sp.]